MPNISSARPRLPVRARRRRDDRATCAPSSSRPGARAQPAPRAASRRSAAATPARIARDGARSTLQRRSRPECASRSSHLAWSRPTGTARPPITAASCAPLTRAAIASHSTSPTRTAARSIAISTIRRGPSGGLLRRRPTPRARRVESARGFDLIVKASGVGVFDELLEAAVLELRTSANLVAFWDVDAPATLDRVHHDPRDPFAAADPALRRDLHLRRRRSGRLRLRGAGRAAVRADLQRARSRRRTIPVPPDPRFDGDLGLPRQSSARPRGARRRVLLQGRRATAGRRSSCSAAPAGATRRRRANIRYFDHVYTRDHNAFNCTPRAVLNISRESMARYGFSPATRVFEAAGAGACLITDAWEGHRAVPRARPRGAGRARRRTRSRSCCAPSRPSAPAQLGRAGVPARARRAHLRASRRAGRSRSGGQDGRRERAMTPPFDIVILGLSVTSSWGNGHATTYRSLVRGLAARGHRVLFLERDQPWYAGNRDEPHPAGALTVLYDSVDELIAQHERAVRDAGAGDRRLVRARRRARRRNGSPRSRAAGPRSTTSTRR